MATYFVNCSLCDKNFGKKETWTRHLFQEEHQEKARLACWKWTETTKKCALAIFLNRGLKMENGSNFVMLLWNHFRKVVSIEESLSLVTDLLWWRERPNIVILRFETWKTADQVHRQMMKGGQTTRSEPPGVKIGNYLVECRKLVDLEGLEWRSVNKETVQDSPTPPPQPSTSLGSPPGKKSKRKVEDVSKKDRKKAEECARKLAVWKAQRKDRKLAMKEAQKLAAKEIRKVIRTTSWQEAWKEARKVIESSGVKLGRKLARKTARKEAKKEARRNVWNEARKQALMETRKVIQTKAWKEGQKKIFKSTGKLARKEANKEAKSEVYKEAWKRAQRKAREKMKLFESRRKEENLKKG